MRRWTGLRWKPWPCTITWICTCRRTCRAWRQMQRRPHCRHVQPAVAAGHCPARAHRLGQVRAGAGMGPAPGRGDRQRRFGPGLPAPGHRRGQALAR
jgi:hypothetical protein